MYLQIYIYIYKYIHMYIFTYIYIYMHAKMGMLTHGRFTQLQVVSGHGSQMLNLWVALAGDWRFPTVGHPQVTMGPRNVLMTSMIKGIVKPALGNFHICVHLHTYI